MPFISFKSFPQLLKHFFVKVVKKWRFFLFPGGTAAKASPFENNKLSLVGYLPALKRAYTDVDVDTDSADETTAVSATAA